MENVEDKIADLLLENNLINDVQFVDAIQEQIISGKTLEDIFIGMGVQREKIEELKRKK
jgi:hypothetical protein